MNKTISYRSGQLLRGLYKNSLSYFSTQDAMGILDQSKEPAIRKLLSNMVKRGLILRIQDGLFNIIPYEREVDEYFPNWHEVAEHLVYPERYYIGFYSALDIYGLITQPSLVEHVVTQKQFFPSSRNIKDVKYQFITYNEKRFFGYENIWINNYSKVYCSDIEKTIIDSLYLPKYANGISEIIKVLDQVKSKLDIDKMKEYLERFQVDAVNKRLGYIIESLGILGPLVTYLKKQLSNSYIPLDPSMPKGGSYLSSWKIIDNINIQSSIKQILN
ncbi:MAG: hypothetical protein RDU14_15460 [Melioribacteraceae bacterium]|nr:hypothetical protein [Melioribacteraceae bacterium]